MKSFPFLRGLNASLVAFAVGVATHAETTVDTFGSGANQFEVEFVTVGNPFNPADTTGEPKLAGSVLWPFRIGKHEVSREIVTRANAAGGLGLTLDDMEQVAGGPRLDMPATGITWLEAARFVNWLNTSTGHTPAYNFVDGVFRLWPLSEGWRIGCVNLYRHKDAFYFLPSEDEWYKAAFYDGATGSYYDYATRSDSPPDAVAAGTDPGTAVYGQSGLQGPANVLSAGGLSPYGTMAQAGNADEWMEGDFDGTNDEPTGLRAYRGGDWGDSSENLNSSARFTGSPADVGNIMGFRVASVVPAPAICIVRDGANVILTWSGTLQSADSVTGAWSDVVGATSPASLPTWGAAHFYRARE
jgi:formylglycine-generating enzyme required for sulfatase activity